MDKKILKSLLNYEFWAINKNRLVASLFEDEVRELFEIVQQSHEKNNVDIPIDALLPLWKDRNPVATRAETGVVENLVAELEEEELLPEELTSEIIEGLWKRDIGKKIGNLGLAIAEGRDEAFEKLKQLLVLTDSGFTPDDFPDPVTDDLEELLEFVSDENRFAINIGSVQRELYGPGPGELWEVFARPETGKTGFVVSLACAPNGFCQQGAKVLYLGNEEDPKRTKLRAIMSYTGMNKDEIIKNPKGALETYSEIAPKMIMQNASGWDMTRLNAYIAKIAPDIVIVDQLDKIGIAGSYDKPTDKLRELYTQARASAGIHGIAFIAVSQASADAEGKTVLTPDQMENSKTGKFAEADVILGIGKFPDNPDGSVDPIRFITVGKNKVSGYHGTITCKIEPKISRYTS